MNTSSNSGVNTSAFVLKFVKNNTLNVLVKPNSGENKVVGYDDFRDAVKINIKAEPEKGKANVELVKFLRKLTKKEVRVVSGHTIHQKVIKLEDI